MCSVMWCWSLCPPVYLFCHVVLVTLPASLSVLSCCAGHFARQSICSVMWCWSLCPPVYLFCHVVLVTLPASLSVLSCGAGHFALQSICSVMWCWSLCPPVYLFCHFFPLTPACPGQYIHRCFQRWTSNIDTCQSGLSSALFTFRSRFIESVGMMA